MNLHNSETPGTPIPDGTIADSADSSGAEPRQNWLRRNLLSLSAGAFVVGSAVTLATNPISGIEHEVISAAPWVAGGLGASEAMWIGGAAMMAGATSKRIGNPFKLRSRYSEITSSVIESKTFKAGLAINTAGALGTAGVVATGAVTSLPVETWPGAVGIAGADAAATIAIRSGIYVSIRENSRASEKTKTAKVTVRHAKPKDIDRLADIDLLLFDKAYGTKKPEKQEVVDMLSQRLTNNPNWMFVAEMGGEIEGFVTAFRTNTPIEDFKSWGECTANGTLDGKVDPDGKYVYVANMTIKHEAVAQGAEDMLLANLFANAIKDGVKYGYFVARMPHFKRWIEDQGLTLNAENKQQVAETYLELRREEDGKRYDPQLRMYEDYGFELKQMVANAFEDDASLDYGVLFQAAIPPRQALKKIKPVRVGISKALRRVAKHPKLLQKIL